MFGSRIVFSLLKFVLPLLWDLFIFTCVLHPPILSPICAPHPSVIPSPTYPHITPAYLTHLSLSASITCLTHLSSTFTCLPHSPVSLTHLSHHPLVPLANLSPSPACFPHSPVPLHLYVPLTHLSLMPSAPARVVTEGGRVTGHAGQVVTVACEATGDDPLTLTWLRHHAPISPGHR